MNEKEKIKIQEKQIVVFELSGENYGVEIVNVYEIIRMQEITEIPRTPEFIEGVINLRGRIIPVIDLRKRFGLSCAEYSKSTRIIVVEVIGQTIGMIVDGVSEVLQIPVDSIEPPSPVISSSIETEYISGIAKMDENLIIMLDLEKVLSKEEKKHLIKVSEKIEKEESKLPEESLGENKN
jgi:purine-binding chemotaxis protein CheW